MLTSLRQAYDYWQDQPGASSRRNRHSRIMGSCSSALTRKARTIARPTRSARHMSHSVSRHRLVAMLSRMHRVVHESPPRRHLLQYRTERPGGRRRTRSDRQSPRASCCFRLGVTSARS
ncbi:hypothetical protein PUN28_020653 [Cardiocondyla obscurior]|uniref:Uncharacterized protein n=1 Tax=Cardiocondyla obscurior TaxID=286306 RepID=A0AAW2EAL6_9HYME